MKKAYEDLYNKLNSSQILANAQKIEEKENIIKLLYKIRYFGLIYVTETEQVKDFIDININQKLGH